MELYEQIAEIKAELSYIENHKDILIKEKNKLEELEKQKNEQEERLYKENKDVENLEKTTIISLFSSIVGNKEDKLEKERREAMDASIEYHRIQNVYQLKKSDIEKLEARLNREELLKEELQQLQCEFIQKNNPQQGQMLQEQLDEYNKLKQEVKEVNEAIQAGNDLNDIVNEVLYELGKAKGWGMYDMIGGGIISTAIKHEHMDTAQRLFETVKVKLSNFEKELQDVERMPTELKEVGMSLTTFDYIFDNVFVDWAVQSQINENKESMEKLSYQVNESLEQLGHKKELLEQVTQEKHQSIKQVLDNI